MDLLTKKELIEAGVHFGHPTHRWNPNFKKFIVGNKNGIHIIDVSQTIKQLETIGKEMIKIVSNGGNILFVGTKKQAREIVQESADKCGMFYVIERWLGGTLTNFSTIKKSIKRLKLLEKESSDIYKNLTKKELRGLYRERLKLSDLHRGIRDMKYLPSALFIVDARREKIAVSEAQKLGIPVFALVDSNTSPTQVNYPIPGNDDSIRSISVIVKYISDLILEVADIKKNSSVASEESSSETNN